MIGIEDIQTAAHRIGSHVRRTPVIDATQLKSPLGDAEVSLKLELLQVTGSFKARGATNRLLAMDKADLARGVVTASGGNHGIATARAAWMAGVPATIFLPSNASPAMALGNSPYFLRNASTKALLAGLLWLKW